jgi:glycogen synthase
MQFIDIRQGSDLEFGQSVYEPFGIAQVEPLSYGALCVVSRICGCVGFLERIGGLAEPNVLLADYTDVTPKPTTLQAALSIDQARRDQVEARKAAEIAHEIMARLPQSEDKETRILESGYQLSQGMSWEVVARDYFLPALQHARQAWRSVSAAT